MGWRRQRQGNNVPVRVAAVNSVVPREYEVPETVIADAPGWGV